MKKILISSMMLMLAATPMAAKSGKRGVSENEFRFMAQLEALEPGISWYYSWGGAPFSGVETFKGFEFVPMCWNASEGFINNAREYYKNHPEVKYILGYNEPNFPNQANMTPEEAAEHWPEVQAIAKEFGLEIVAPALNYSPGEWQPVAWMDRFIELVGKDAFEYLAIHNYGGLGVMKELAGTFHDRYGKDVWVTEFCYWPGESGYVAPATQISTMAETVKWLEQTPWIYRYAWFKSIGRSDSKDAPNYGLLISGKGEEPRELSDQGYVYVYLPDFDKERFHPVNTLISAVDVVDFKGAQMGRGNYSKSPLPIEVTQFSAGSTLDYQFDIPADGDYTLRLTVSGQGEPVRFDPCIAIYSVAEDGKEGDKLVDERQFPLSGDDAKYQDEDFKMTLKAGKQTLRLKDMYPFQPSGIRISTVELYQGDAPASGVGIMTGDAANATPEYFDLQGRRIENPTAAGIYIERRGTETKKIIIR